MARFTNSDYEPEAISIERSTAAAIAIESRATQVCDRVKPDDSLLSHFLIRGMGLSGPISGPTTSDSGR
jgi:hypothetical protein